MKTKIFEGIMFILPETEKEKQEVIKWQDNVLENYDPLADWMFYIETKGDKESIFKNPKIYKSDENK